MCYPLPKKLIREFADGVRNVIVVEELDPFIEEQVRAMGIPARGKDIFSICGELLPEDIAESCRRAASSRIRPPRSATRPNPSPAAARCCVPAARTAPRSTTFPR